jgi:sulfur carrier protein ThiS adenylyltransferase
LNRRYSRQELFSPIGKDGQAKIIKKHVLIVGAGALGAANAEALVRAGVGKVTIVDRDYVEWSNLQRQQLYCEEDAIKRIPKAIAAANRLKQINSQVEIDGLMMDVGIEELEQLIQGVDLVIDSTDHFEIRMIINDLSQKYEIPWIYGACVGSYGLSFTILPKKTPCLNCLLETMPLGGATCDTVGIIQPAVQMVSAHQIAEALKLLADRLAALRNKLVSFDLWKNQYSSVDVTSLKKETCPSCGVNRIYPFLAYENQLKTAVLCGRDTVQIRPPENREIDLKELDSLLTLQGIQTERNPYLLSFYHENARLVVFKDGRMFVHGIKDVVEAKTLYHRYLG